MLSRQDDKTGHIHKNAGMKRIFMDNELTLLSNKSISDRVSVSRINLLFLLDEGATTTAAGGQEIFCGASIDTVLFSLALSTGESQDERASKVCECAVSDAVAIDPLRISNIRVLESLLFPAVHDTWETAACETLDGVVEAGKQAV